MFSWILKKIVGSKNEREIKKLIPLVKKINEIEEKYQKYSDEEIKNLTSHFKERLSKGETLDDIMCEAFAAVKNTCRRLLGTSWKVTGHTIVWDMVPFDVQIMGAIVLHQGKIAEMATGEGKTLVATMPLYLNALTGKNVHLVTVNDYLAQRDSEWMGKIYEFLGLTVGFIKDDMSAEEKKAQYACDITYGTNSTFGFDYLRDNGLVYSPEDQVQRGHYYAIIDEVDSILIDEARTPLIISGPIAVSPHKYDILKPRVERLVRNQNLLCNRILKEIIEKKDNLTDEDAIKLYQVSIGAPKNRRFMKLMEDVKYKKLLEKAERILHLGDTKKELLHRIKEELFYTIDEKNHSVELTEKGRDAISTGGDKNEFVLPDIVGFYAELEGRQDISEKEKQKLKARFQKKYEEKSEKIHNLTQLLKAYALFEKDVDYVVQDNKVIIVDEFTGRLQPGRRFSDGLHQALEAKENVKIEKATQTIASITIQNYFRMYEKLAGMTGTAATEADEFYQIYKMDVVSIPTNVPVRRVDYDDVVYKTKREKYKAIIDEVVRMHNIGRPVLLGTISVEVSEVLSRMLSRRGIKHEVLNAKNHQREAEIIAKAGEPGSVVIATNMAGRGTDIKIKKPQGVPEFDEKGNPLVGLHVIGSERHESRRIDLQLRGRSGRQGDPGSSIFFISLEDDLMRLFGSDKIIKIMEKLGMEEGQEIRHPLLNRAIRNAQKRVEESNFAIRKQTLEFDEVLNKQREVVYGIRNEILHSENIKDFIMEKIEEYIEDNVERFFEDENPEASIASAKKWFESKFPITLDSFTELKDIKTREELKDFFIKVTKEMYELKEKFETPQSMRNMEKYLTISIIDNLWKEHLYNMDDLRSSIGLRSYGQRDPLIEYKSEGFFMFENMMKSLTEEIATGIFRITSLHSEEELLMDFNEFETIHQEVSALQGGAQQNKRQGEKRMPIKKPEKVGRNDPCPCGSGKKYKKCCGK